MRKLLASAGISVLSFSLTCVGQARADERFKGPDEDGTKPALTKIAGEGMMNSHAFEYLTELSDNVGARVTGTPEAQKAIDWGIAKMRGIGLENVHAEKWQLWRGWRRGTADAELITPIRHKLHVDAMGWTGSTAAGGVEAEIVPVNVLDLDHEMKEVARLKGKNRAGRGKRQSAKRWGYFRAFRRFSAFGSKSGRAGCNRRSRRRKSQRNEPDAHRNSRL